VAGHLSEAGYTALQSEVTEAVRAAAREAEAVGTLGKSRPEVAVMFEDIFEQPDWRLKQQRDEARG
jgi:2-oxoisovalerate dehydrogenase E1 component alpha subunit